MILNKPNVNELIIGQFYTRKQICACFDVEQAQGSSRNGQTNEFYRYLKLEKIKNKFKYLGEQEYIPKKIDGRTEKSSYGDDIQLLILLLILQSGETSLTMTSNELARKLEIINQKYFENKSSNRGYSRINKDVENVKDFYRLFNRTMQRLVKISLNKLEDRAFLHWEYKYMIKSDNGYREATDIEISDILLIEGELLSEFNVKNKGQIFNSLEKTNKYNYLMKQRIKDEYNYDGFYIAVHIIPTSDLQRMNIEAIKLEYAYDEISKEKLRVEANNKICQQQYKNAENKVKSEIQDNIFIISDEDITMWDNWLNNRISIINSIIKIDT